MSDFHLMRPFWLLAFIPVVILWWRVYRKQDAWTVMEQVIDPHLLEHLLVARGRKRRLRPVGLLLVFWVILVLALAGPSWSKTRLLNIFKDRPSVS